MRTVTRGPFDVACRVEPSHDHPGVASMRTALELQQGLARRIRESTEAVVRASTASRRNWCVCVAVYSLAADNRHSGWEVNCTYRMVLTPPSSAQ
jgi:hypothetical protein